jgi:hypothetical protein
MIHQDAPHRLSGYGEEMIAAFQVSLLLIDQAKVGFVHERGGLQRVIGTLPAEVGRCQAVEFVVNQGISSARAFWSPSPYRLNNKVTSDM